MKFREQTMKFGIFIGPYHRPGMNPTVAFDHDMDVLVQLDKLGFDEAWIGEHHSGGIETIGNPELMIAAAAMRTTRIKLGTGVCSLPYHNPFMVADRIVQLDHMTKGRVMLGVGPGQLLRDAQMIGLDPMQSRVRLGEAFDVVLRLCRGETVTKKTDWFDLREAVLQMRPYSDFDVAVVSVISPSGPLLAGKHGAGLISVAATDPVGITKLKEHWQIVERESGKAGLSADRAQWRMMGPMHLAETAEQARKDVRHGLSLLEDYRAHINPAPDIDFFDTDKLIDMCNETGSAVIGTPDMAVKQIRRLIEASGGFGTYLLMGVDWANLPATLRSHQLFAEEVIPQFMDSGAAMRNSFEQVMGTGYMGAQVTAKAQEKFAERYKATAGSA